MPAATTALTLGLIGNYLKPKLGQLAESGAQQGLQKLFEHCKERLNDGTIPANKELHEAIEQSLFEAARAFAYGVAVELGPKPPLVEAMRKHLRDGTFTKTPLTQMRTVTGADWVAELLKEADKAHKARDKGIVADFILAEDEVTTLLTDTQATGTAFQNRVRDAFTGWLARHVQEAERPACVDDFLANGWPLEPGSPKRLHFYQVFVLFFREKLKTVAVVRDIFLAQTTSRTAKDVKALLAQFKLTDAGLRTWLGSQFELLKEVKADTAHIRKKVDTIAQDVSPVLPLARYKEALIEAYGVYDELGQPITSGCDHDAKLVMIGDIFVEPSCSSSRLSPADFEATVQSCKAPGEALLTLLEDLLTNWEQRRVVLIGDPGMGKSTFVKWLIVSPLLKGKARGKSLPPSLQDCIPLPFIVRDLVRHLPDDITEWDWAALVQAFREFRAVRNATKPLLNAFDGNDPAFESLLADPRVLFLVDGLDELGDPRKRTAFRNAIWQGFENTGTARWIITSRWIGYEEAPVDLEEEVYSPVPKGTRKGLKIRCVPGPRPTREPLPEHWIERGLDSVRTIVHAHRLFLTPFSNQQQDDYARNWFIARKGKALGEARALSLMQEVRRVPSIRIISRVPNLLCLMALLKLQDVPLPDGRSQLYEAITTAYLKTIDEARELGEKHGHLPPCDMKEAVRWLAIIAMHLQNRRSAQPSSEGKQADIKDDNEILATLNELHDWLQPVITEKRGGKAADSLVKDFLRYVSQRTAFLQERGEGQYGFIHLSFQEYYAACWLELEFRRLNQKDNMDDSDIFAAPPTVSAAPRHESLLITEAKFAARACTTVWREPLLFLGEKLRDEHDFRTLRRWLFPWNKNETPPLPVDAAQLLATFSVDKQVNLPDAERTSIWSTLWKVWRQQQPEAAWAWHPWHVAPALLGATDYCQAVLACLQPHLAGARALTLCRCTGLSDLTLLTDLTSLETLSLSSCPGLSDLTPLKGLASLQELYLTDCTGLSDITPLKDLSNLTALDLTGCTGISDLTPLKDLASLRTLRLRSCTGISDLAALKDLASLRELFLIGCTGISDLAALKDLASLQFLFLNGCSSLSDLSPLKDLASLVRLLLIGCTGISDLSPLAKLTSLHELDLRACGRISDLSPLADLGTLRCLFLAGTAALAEGKLEDLQKALPNCKIYGM